MSANYKSNLYEKVSRMEKGHFWFRARNELLRQVICRKIPISKFNIQNKFQVQNIKCDLSLITRDDKYLDRKADPRIREDDRVGSEDDNTKTYLQARGRNLTFLEVGFGTGAVLPTLVNLGFRVTGIDINARAIEYAKKVHPEASLIRSSLEAYKPKKLFDAVGAFDVLEHQKDDIKFLKSLNKILKKGGLAVLTVPSGRWLYNEYDRESGHFRRYEAGELIRKLHLAGFSVKYISYWQTLALPLFIPWRLNAGRSGRDKAVESALRTPPAIINFMLEFIYLVERIILGFIRLPFGASLIVTTEKY